MKRARCQKLFIIGTASACFMISIGTMRIVFQSMLKNAPVTIHHDELLDTQYQSYVTQTLAEAIKNHGPEIRSYACQEQFPVLSDITLSYRMPLQATMRYTVLFPELCLNNSIGLLSNGTLIASDIFIPDCIATIPHLEVPTELLLSPEIPSALQQYAKHAQIELLQRFSCVWHNEYTCYYHDKNHAQYTLVYEGYAPPTDNDIALYDQALARHTLKDVHKKWLVDLRFKNQVVIAPFKEYTYGTRVT